MPSAKIAQIDRCRSDVNRTHTHIRARAVGNPRTKKVYLYRSMCLLDICIRYIDSLYGKRGGGIVSTSFKIYEAEVRRCAPLKNSFRRCCLLRGRERWTDDSL